MSLDRRKALLDWAAEQEAYVLEDDYDGDYRYEGRPIASLQGMDANGRVIYIGSFNKILFPGLRIAYAIVPEALVGTFIDAKHVADGHTALLTQGVLAAFIRDGHLARHIRKTRTIYDERRRAFLDEAKILEDFVDLGPARGGMHVTGTFKNDRTLRLDDRAVAAECARSGIEVHPLSKLADAKGGRGGSWCCALAPLRRGTARAARFCTKCSVRWRPTNQAVWSHERFDYSWRTRTGIGAGGQTERGEAGCRSARAVIVKRTMQSSARDEKVAHQHESDNPTAHAEIVAMRARRRRSSSVLGVSAARYDAVCHVGALSEIYALARWCHAPVKRLVCLCWATNPPRHPRRGWHNLCRYIGSASVIECTPPSRM